MDDLATVDDITRRAYAHYIPILGAEPQPMLVDYAPRIAAGEVWLAERDGGAVGLIAFEDHGDHLHIFSVAVDPAQQSRGIGRALLDFAVETARTMDRPMLTLCTGDRMVRNIGIYRRFGFTEIERRPNPRRPDWTLVDMEMPVPPAETRRSA
jgi:ribosomal protein S18 acetylase RimI-like enzyme